MTWITNYSCSFLVFLVVLLALDSRLQKCQGLGGTFTFDIHHRFSEPVKEILTVDGLPEKNSVNYFKVLAHRDRLIRGRHLAAGHQQSAVTFLDGNTTFRIGSLGYLHYANVTVGTPALSFLVALDTGSDLFWLPCDCSSCVHGLKNSKGERIGLNIFSPNTSSSSSKVNCNSSLCEQASRCPSALSNCPYQIRYLSNGTSSIGYLVEDVLHLVTDDKESNVVSPRITFGCGQVQTGSFLQGAAPNGLFGLGLDAVSVPSILAQQGVASNSFSMCFADNGIGRISFGDKGSSDQAETPFSIRKSHPTYNISLSQINVGGNVANLEFNAIFDTGTSFTYLSDPAYKVITETFNSLALDKRDTSLIDIPFEFCYDLSQNEDNFKYPILNLTMKGGSVYQVLDPLVMISIENGGTTYCLGVVKSDNINIVGQNFMTGYSIVFDREKMVLGWKESDCYNINSSSTVRVQPPISSTIPPVSSINPEATQIPSTGTSLPSLTKLLAFLLLPLLPILAFL